MFKPRPYQVPAIETCIAIMTHPKSRKELVVQPTAAGKSWLTAATVDRLGVPIVVLQPSGELLKQNYEKFELMGGKATISCSSLKVKQKDGVPYTLIGDEYVKCNEISKVTYATIGSVIKDIETFKKMKLKHLIIDEAHLMTKSDSQIRRFIDQLKITNVLGLTATPVYLANTMEGAMLKMMNRVRGKLFSTISHVTQISEVASQGYWTKLIYKVIETDTSVLRPNSNGSDFTIHSQKEYYEANSLKNQIVEELRNMLSQGRKSILVFLPSIQEAEELFSIFPNSAVVHSQVDSKTRDYVVRAFKNLDIPVVFNINVLATGFDHPELDGIITARPTSSIAIYYQQIGRLTRPHDNKENGLITDFSGNVLQFGRVEHITFENLPNYGWGMFGEGGVLLTGYPIKAISRPTKETLQQEYVEKKKKLGEDYGADGSIKFWFGKYSKKTVKEVAVFNKHYLTWVYENFDFNGNRMKQLKKSLEIELKLLVTADRI